MVVISCPFGCGYLTEDVSEALVTELIKLHVMSHSTQQASRGPKLNRPTIDVGANEEMWTSFKRRWQTFRRGSQISDNEAAAQLFECASHDLSELALKLDQELTTKSVEEVMSALHSLAVIPIAKGVTRAELMRMEQNGDEAFRTFAARVKGKAETCGFNFNVKCKCGDNMAADYTQETMRDVLLAGIADVDIRREALSSESLQHQTINELISFVERREMSRSAASGSSISAMSTFRRNQAATKPSNPDHQQSIRVCPGCQNPFKVYRKGKNGWNRKPFQRCYDCHRKGQTPRNWAAPQNVCEITSGSTMPPSKVSAFVLSHNIFKDNCWLAANYVGHPKVTLQLRHIKSNRVTTLSAIADTGAQSNLWSYNDFKAKGFTDKDLEPVTCRISAANNQCLNILGAFNAKFEGVAPDSTSIECSAVVFVSDSVSSFYLSCDSMRELFIINRSFPTIGDFRHSPTSGAVVDCVDMHSQCSNPPFARVLNSGCVSKCDAMLSSVSSGKCVNDVPCSCPQRECVPTKPKSLPFPAIPENNEKMREWLLNRFASSTFNTCPHRPLQQMAGPPMEIHINESAEPKVCEKAAHIPLHWQEKVHQDLIRDEALGVIERVPYGVTTTWCHRMVVTKKHNGNLRRTVDLSPLNRYCKRETHSAESPFRLARRIPHGTWKTVTDAWNGYHSVPLRESDRHYMTFITPFGRWRYLRAPQGFLSSGDAYNRRFEAVLADFLRKERCVDDTIHYDEDLEMHWWLKKS